MFASQTMELDRIEALSANKIPLHAKFTRFFENYSFLIPYAVCINLKVTSLAIHTSDGHISN